MARRLNDVRANGTAGVRGCAPQRGPRGGSYMAVLEETVE